MPAKAPIFNNQIFTIERFILEQERNIPDASGVLSDLLYDMAISAKLIASHTTRAGLADILGSTGEENVQGEIVQRLDRFAELTIYRMNDHTRRLAAMASEEVEDFIPIPEQHGSGREGKYVLIYDPLDGSSNIDCNVSVGTIFAIYRRQSPVGEVGTLEDCLQAGRNIAAAGYIIYGTSTMMVYSAGQGVHGFTLDPHIGEFLLSHPNIRVPKKAKYYSVNQGYERQWSPGVQRYTKWLQGDNETGKSLSMRYIGSLVADFHRNLLDGGIYYYPADIKDPAKPQGKLRLQCEANPLAFLVEHAGGYASDGHQRILDIEPTHLHQRVPLYIGSRELVEKAEEFIRELDGVPA